MEYLTLASVSQRLGRSKKTVARYIKQGKLPAKKCKSKRGSLEYRITLEALEAFKKGDFIAPGSQKEQVDRTDRTPTTGQSGQTGQKATGQTGHFTGDNTPEYLKEITDILKNQLEKKDEQIKSLSDKIDTLIERDRETNILLGQLQSRLVLEGTDWTDKTGQTGQSTGDRVDTEGEPGEEEEHIEGKERVDRTEGTEGTSTEDKTEKRDLWSILFKKIL